MILLILQDGGSQNSDAMSTSTVRGLPKDVELINGKFEFNNALEKSTAGSVMYKTLDIDPMVSIFEMRKDLKLWSNFLQTHQVRTTKPGELVTPGNAVFRWKPVTASAIPEVSH